MRCMYSGTEWLRVEQQVSRSCHFVHPLVRLGPYHGHCRCCGCRSINDDEEEEDGEIHLNYVLNLYLY